MTAPPSPLDARRAALAVLAAVLDKRQDLDTALAAAPGVERLAPRDRAFTRLLVATALRRKGEAHALIAEALDRPLAKSARTVQHILTLGLVQLLMLETPAHAAVDTSVRLAAKIAGGRFRGLVNAVLRRLGRDGKNLLAALDGPRLNTPDWLWKILETSYGETAARAIAAAHAAEPHLDLNLRDPVEAHTWAERLDARVLPTGGLRRAAGGRIEDLPGFAAGAWWVQDAAASLPARLLPDIWGKRVLDLCAAPGGKTLQLVAAGARVTALDLSPERLELVRDNLARLGLSAELMATDARDFDPGDSYDGVLLDAPCTASGTIRRHPDIPYLKGGDDAARLAPLQDALLDRAAALTAPGGVLVYAVCSLDPKEGEDRIAAFLGRHDTYRLEAADPNALGGEAGWRTAAGELRTRPDFWSDLGGMDGFYAARLRRLGEAGR